MTDSITITTPDDFHYHFRDDDRLARTVPDAAKQFGRVIAMPNTKRPITDIKLAGAYRERILQHLPSASTLEPLMTLYLTEQTSTAHIIEAAQTPWLQAIKLYPAGVTTGSSAGIADFSKLYPLFDAMQQHNLPLLIHAEVADPAVDCFDREAVFIDRYLKQWVKDFPQLRMVMEHVTTRKGVEFVQSAPQHVAATITPHHLWCNRNHLLAGRIRPHYFCLPLLKRASDQQALIKAATSGDPHFFLGSDGAPHSIGDKESSCGCAGIYHGPYTLAFYAALFDQENALDQLENFCSRFGCQFYGLPPNPGTVTLIKQKQKITPYLDFTADSKPSQVVPLFAGQDWPWQLQSAAS